MLTKAEWFRKRKYGGWGLTPCTWQGWVYVGIFVAIITSVQSFSFLNNSLKNAITIILTAFFIGDVLRIMATLKEDELEEKNEAIAERNASWAMVFVLATGIIYQVISNNFKSIFDIDPFLLGTLIAGFAAKGISYFILEKK